MRYALGPVPPAEHFAGAEAELPEAYGTGRLFLMARDPHWLYAHWDLTRAQQRACNARSLEGHLVLRVYVNEPGGAPQLEVHLHPESRHWFVPGVHGGTKYVTELGYYNRRGAWVRVAVSDATVTPADVPGEEGPVEFATIPVDFPLPRLVELVKRAALEHLPLARAIEELRAAGHPALPRRGDQPAAAWTPEQERALAEVVSLDAARRVWLGSVEITELIRRAHERQMASPAGAAFGAPTSPAGAAASVSSPFGGAPPGAKGFWFNVNAELVLYGATEPDAAVHIAGRPVRLRADGSFSYRFALPDGQYELPIVAVSADRTEGRAAELKFSRQTAYRGEVGAAPQEANLQPPTPAGV